MLMILNPKTVDKTVAKFVINTLLTTSGEWDYEYLNEIIQAIDEDSATIPKTLTGGKHG